MDWIWNASRKSFFNEFELTGEAGLCGSASVSFMLTVCLSVLEIKTSTNRIIEKNEYAKN